MECKQTQKSKKTDHDKTTLNIVSYAVFTMNFENKMYKIYSLQELCLVSSLSMPNLVEFSSLSNNKTTERLVKMSLFLCLIGFFCVVQILGKSNFLRFPQS